MSGFNIPELSATEAAQRLKVDPSARLIDVRTDEEYDVSRIEGSILVNNDKRLDDLLQLPKSTPLIVHCHHGIRSLSGAGFFLQNGFTEVYNLAGGIDAWSRDVDATVPRY